MKLESIFIGPLTYMSLQGVVRNLEEKLDDREIKRIKEKNIFISLVSNPASRVRYRQNPFKDLSYVNLILVDNNFCSKYRSNVGQLEAVILHEIGHVLNEPNSKDVKLQEFSADDYVRYCDFEKGLLDNLELEMNSLNNSEKVELIQERIDRINSDAELIINFNSN